MKTVAKKLYEAMFLVDSALAGSDWDGVLATIKTILQRAEAEIVELRKWADRKLLYEIDHKTKGTYILCYFRADGKRIRDIERDVRLSEKIMRALILNAEKQTLEGSRKPVPSRVEGAGSLEAGQKDTSVMPAEKGQTQAQNAEQEQTTADQKEDPT